MLLTVGAVVHRVGTELLLFVLTGPSQEGTAALAAARSTRSQRKNNLILKHGELFFVRTTSLLRERSKTTVGTELRSHRTECWNIENPILQSGRFTLGGRGGTARGQN